MKLTVFAFILVFILSCTKNNDIERLNQLLSNYKFSLSNYSVVCIIPADGCSSCINKTIGYFNDNNPDVLLILTSHHKKSIEKVISDHNIIKRDLIIDNKSLAGFYQLANPIGPTIYLLKNSRLYRKLDTSEILARDDIPQMIGKFINGHLNHDLLLEEERRLFYVAITRA